MPNKKRKTAKPAKAKPSRYDEQHRNGSEAQARERADTLCRHLIVSDFGSKWRPRVWHNMGWHYSVEAFPSRSNIHAREFSVHPDLPSQPLGACWVSFIPEAGAQIHLNADTPTQGLRMIGDRVRAILADYKRALK